MSKINPEFQIIDLKDFLGREKDIFEPNTIKERKNCQNIKISFLPIDITQVLETFGSGRAYITPTLII